MTAILKIYQTESGQWAGQLVDESGEELAGVAGCESPEAVEMAAQDAELEYDTAVYLD
jgi:hypothetical protein